MEMGKTYGYAGKICYCGYARETSPYQGFRDSHIQKQIDELKDLIKKYLEPRTIPIKPAPEPEPCKHEPWDLNIDKMIDGDFVMLTYTKRDGVMTTICKCGARIRAKGWEAV